MSDVVMYALEALGLAVPVCCILAVIRRMQVRVLAIRAESSDPSVRLSWVSRLHLVVLGALAHGTNWPNFSLIGLGIVLSFSGLITFEEVLWLIGASLFPSMDNIPPSGADAGYPLNLAGFSGSVALLVLSLTVLGAAAMFRWIAGRHDSQGRDGQGRDRTLAARGALVALLCLAILLRHAVQQAAGASLVIEALPTGALIGVALWLVLQIYIALERWYLAQSERRRDDLVIWVVVGLGVAVIALLALQTHLRQPALFIAYLTLTALYLIDPALKLLPPEKPKIERATKPARQPPLI